VELEQNQLWKVLKRAMHISPLAHRVAATALVLSLLAIPVKAKDTIVPIDTGADRLEVLSIQGKPTAVVGLMEAQALAVVDLDSQQIKAKIPLGFEPIVTRVDVAQNRAYVAGLNSNSIAVVDLNKNEVIQTIDLSAGVFDIDIDPARKLLVATHPKAGQISVVRLDGSAKEKVLVRSLPMPNGPLACAIDQETGNIWISLANNEGLGLVLVNPDNGELLARLRSGSNPEDLALDTKHNRAVLLNSGSQDLSIVPLSLGGTFRSVGLDWKPTRLVLSADGKFAYVTSRDSDRIQIVDLDAGRTIGNQKVGSAPTGVARLGSSLVVVEAGAKSLRWITNPLATNAATANSSSSTLKTEVSSSKLAPTRKDIGAVAGQVTDLAGNAVAKGALTVEGRKVPILPDGSFLLSQLPPGKYLVDVEVPGFPKFTARVQARGGYVATNDIQLPPRSDWATKKFTVNQSVEGENIGILADAPQYSELFARSLMPLMDENLTKKRKVLVLNGPLGPAPEFARFASAVEGLSVIDRNNRYTQEVEKLKALGRTLGLRYIVFTQVVHSRGYDQKGNPFINSIFKIFVPVEIPNIPNFTPNQLRAQGAVLVLDLQKTKIGEKANFLKVQGQDDVGGDPLYEESADGLFRLEIRNMAQEVVKQWQQSNPFTS
jgi:DNA-binding beta-propeller fold protein YncE